MKTTTRISDRYYRQYRQTTDEDIYNKDRYQRQLDKTTDEHNFINRQINIDSQTELQLKTAEMTDR